MAGLYHGWSDEPDQHADFRHGGVPIEDFEDVFPHKKKRGKKKPHSKKGCPENDGGPHVYIWVPWYSVEAVNYEYSWYRWYRQYEVKVCCGCRKRAPRKSFRRIASVV